MLRRRRLSGGGEDIFKFVPAWATFTPSMSKRNSAGPFAAGVMIQGKVDESAGDTFSFSSGNKIKSGFYPNVDINQGSLIFWITPEWDGDDGKNHIVFGNYANAVPYIYKTNTSRLAIFLHSDYLYELDVSSWVAGNTYCVVLRWDVKNKVDGTNYACISVNDVHTFFKSTAISPFLDNDSMVIGGAPIYQLDAILEGLTIYRRVLFDGTYGQDIGNGDELALIYAAGTGKDPTEITGSWDVVFCLPTNATAGALVTGTGEAWSHPHSSNILKDGWLADGFYGGGKYVIDTPADGFVRVEDSAGIQDLHKAAVTFEGWIRFGAFVVDYPGFIEKSGGYGMFFAINQSLWFTINNDYVHSPSVAIVPDGKYHHVAFTYDDTGDRIARIWIDGILVASGTAFTGVLPTDAGSPLFIGRAMRTGWTRISNSIRYSATFTPARTPPAPDANTIGQWNMSEGTGATVDNAEGTAARDGTITNGSWVTVWDDEGTPLVPVSVAFNGTSTLIDCGTESSAVDIHDGSLTAEAWACLDPAKVDGGYLISKRGGDGGWFLSYSSSWIVAYVYCATTNAVVTFNYAIDGKWHHYLITFDDAGDRKIRLYIDGVLVATGDAGVGAVITDATYPLYLGNYRGFTYYIDGNLGWTRISNSIRYTANFIPPSRVTPPANDANTVRLFKMDEGTGTVITDSSTNAQNATLSNGSWNTVRDMAIDSPGARTYNWGHVLGSDAADEGIKQTFAGLTAGADYVIRALAYSEDGIGQPRLVVYDETNGAEISHLDAFGQQDNLVLNGGFDDGSNWSAVWVIGGGKATHDVGNTTELYQATPTIVAGKLYKVTYTVSGRSAGSVKIGINDWAGNGTSRSADGTFSENIIGGVGSAYVDFIPTADFDGAIDNVSVTLIPDEQHPEPLIFSFELPTIARAGVAADCVSMSVKLVNAANDGVVGWNQCELLPLVLDNPSFQTGAVADPFVPDGWSNYLLDAGDIAQDVAGRSGNGILFNAGAIMGEGLYAGALITAGKFYSVGVFHKGGQVRLIGAGGGRVAIQSSLAVEAREMLAVTGWKFEGLIYRKIGATVDSIVFYNNGVVSYIDDAYAIALDDVSLTATPASLANSQESGGIRVDGNDSLTQPIPAGKLKATSGKVKASVIMRHSLADVVKFGNLYSAILAIYQGTTGARLQFFLSVDLNTCYLEHYNGISWVSVQVNIAGYLSAGVTTIVELSYTSERAMLKLNGNLVATLVTPIDFGGSPTTMYLGVMVTGIYQADAVFLP